MNASSPHSEPDETMAFICRDIVSGWVKPNVAGDVLKLRMAQAYLDLEEQYQALRLAATRQLTPLDVAATHIDILRRKSEEYGPQERDNVALIVEQHVNEARKALFDAISNPATSSEPSNSHHSPLAGALVNQDARTHEDGSEVPSPAKERRDCTCRLGPRLAYKWGDHHDEGCIMREPPSYPAKCDHPHCRGHNPDGSLVSSPASSPKEEGE